MRSIILEPEKLKEETIDKIYEIHQHVYVRKGIGHNKDTWIENLLKKYHNNTKKQIQLFSNNNNTEINGYSISTGPISIENDNWYKIIEAGVKMANHHDAITVFLTMINERIKYVNSKYICEIDVQKENMDSLLTKKTAFKHVQNKDLAKALMCKFLGNTNYTIEERFSELIIKRSTQIKNQYIGKILYTTSCSYFQSTLKT